MFALFIFLSTMSPFSTQAEETCIIEGVCMYEVTKDVGEQLTLTCICPNTIVPYWLVEVNNASETYFVGVSGNPLPPSMDYVRLGIAVNGTNYSLITIFVNITDSTILHCKTSALALQAEPKPFVVVVNTEPECPSPTPCQPTTTITVNSIMDMIPTPAPPCICSSLTGVGNNSLSSEEMNPVLTSNSISAGYLTAIDTSVPTTSMCLTTVSKEYPNVTTTLRFTTTRVTTATVTTTTITTLYPSPNDIVCSSPSVVGSNFLSSEEINPVTTSNTISADPCLLTNEETVGLSSSLAIAVVIESLVIVALLIIIRTKANCCRKNHMPHINQIEATNGVVIEMNEEATGQEIVQGVLENGQM